MRAALVSLGLSALIVATPMVVSAAPALRSIMHAWRDDARATHAMLYGRAAFDEAAIRAALQRYAADAGSVAARVNGHTARARDFKGRFVAFQAQAQATLGDIGRRPALEANFSRLINDCQSCHHVFN